MRPISDE